MASIKKRGNSYLITVSNGRKADGSQIIETKTYSPAPGMTQKQIAKELERVAVEFERDVKSGISPKKERTKFKTAAEMFLNDTKPNQMGNDCLEETSWHAYKRTLELRILPILGNKAICDISSSTMKNYCNSLREGKVPRSDGRTGGLSENTIRKDRNIVSSILSYCVGEGLIPLNPLIYAGKQNTRHKTTKEYSTEYFTIDQAKAFLWALDNVIEVHRCAHTRKHKNGTSYSVPAYSQQWSLDIKWRAYFYLMLFLGDRREENIAFTWNDINFATGEVNIDKGTVYVNGKLKQKGTKNRKSRIAVVPQVVIEILKAYKSSQKELSLQSGDKWIGYRGSEFDKNFVFTQENGKQMHPSSPYHQFKRIIKIYNDNVAKNDSEKIPENATPHGLRHTAASIMIANGMDPRSVAGVLGHSNPTTTLNIYSYFFRNKNQEAADIMFKNLINKTEAIDIM